MEEMKAIDVHGHYGVSKHERYTDSDDDTKFKLINEFMTGHTDEVIRRAEMAGIEKTIVSPLDALLIRNTKEVLDGNRHAFSQAQIHKEILQWVVIHPMCPESFDQASEMLEGPNCVGIKIHPETHKYPIVKYGEALFQFAAERKAVVLVHSGEENSQPKDYLFFADRFPEMKVILAHLGFGWDGDYSLQVRAIQKSKHNNLYTDTSSARSITPNLIEWAVREIGSERILFGTDAPLYMTSMQRARIDYADISTQDKKRILYENAKKLLDLN